MSTHHDPLTSSHELSRLSNSELLKRTRLLRGRERHATAEIVAHLAEVEARKLHLREGYSSLFDYCRNALGYAEFPALARMRAARASRDYPVLLQYLADGRLHLSAVVLLVQHLTHENHVDLFDRATGLSKRDVEKLVAEIAPRPIAPTVIRKVAAPSEVRPQNAEHLPIPGSVNNLPVLSEGTPQVCSQSHALPHPIAPPKAPSTRVEPLTSSQYRVQFTADAETIALLKQCQDLLGHQLPNAQPAEVVKRALRELAARLEKAKSAGTARVATRRVDNTNANAQVSGSRYIPAAVRREVWARDHARCAFRNPSGQECRATRCLEYHHVAPFAKGGQATVKNIQLRCRAHNQFEAEIADGKRWKGVVRELPSGYELRFSRSFCRQELTSSFARS